AIPQYQNYIARSQFSEAHTLLGGARVAVQEKIDQGLGSSFSDLGLQTAGEFGVVAGEDLAANAETYDLVYTFRPASNTNVRNKFVTYTYTAATGVWSCKTNVEATYATRCEKSS